jgi:hypothetical protein
MTYLLKAFLSLAALPLLGLMPALAEVVTFAAGPAYGGASVANNGGQVTCRIYNNGTSAKLSLRRIFANTNVTVPQNGGNSCTGTLAPRTYCAYSHIIAGNLAYTCTITAEANRASIVGVAEITNEFGEIVTVVPFSR